MSPRRRVLSIGKGLSLPLDVVSRRTCILGQTDTGKTSTAVVLVEEAAKCGAQFVIIDPTDAWWGLNSSADGKGPGVDCVVMGGPHGDVPLDEHAGRVVAGLVADEGYNVVLCLKALGSWGARQRFVADFMAELYEKAHSQILVVIDEAHRFAPQAVRDESSHTARCLGAVTDVVLLGRRQGLSTVTVTQRPARLHKDVLEMSEIAIAHRLRGNNDRKAFQGWIDEVDLDARAIMAEVGGLKKGVAHVSAPTLGINGTYTIRKKETFDSSESIGVGAVAREPKVRAQIDMSALRERMAATIEKAKADDPRELRKRIAELERARPPEPKEVEVKVIVPDKAAVDKMVALRDEMETHTDQLLDELEEAAGKLETKVAVVREIRGELHELLNETTAVLDTVGMSQRRVETAPRQPEGGKPVITPVGRGLSSSAPPRPVASNGSDPHDVKPAQRKLLNALASLEAIGVPQADKKQLALFAGVSPKSGAYFSSLGKLRSSGLIEYPTGGAAALTEAGRAEADASDAPSTTAELHERVRRIIKEAKWKIVDALIAVYPDSMPKEDLAVSIGVSPKSGAYFNSLGNLRSLGLIDYPSPGTAAATDVLFLAGA